MRTIYKYPLQITDFQTVKVPAGASPLTAQMQGDQLCLWAMIDTDVKETVDAVVKIFGTGNPVELDGEWGYMGSVQQSIFVWHVFVGEGR